MEEEIFDEMYKLENRHWWFVARRKIISAVIGQMNLPKEGKILDAGCGNGDNLSLLAQFGHVTAIEKDVKAKQRAVNRNIGQIFQGALPEHIPKEIKSDYDLIVLLDVLEHIDDDSGSIKAVSKLLNIHGKLLITVPAFQFLWTHHDTVHHHKRRYTKRTLSKVIKENGLNIKYISYFNFLLFPAAVVERLVKKYFSKSVDDTMKIPNPVLNLLLERIFGLERLMINRMSLPFGLSVIAIVEKE